MSNSPIIPANNATNSSMNDVIINNKTITISSTNKEEDEKIVKKVKKTKKKAMTLSSIPSKRNINSSSHNVKIEDFDIPKKKKTKKLIYYLVIFVYMVKMQRMRKFLQRK